MICKINAQYLRELKKKGKVFASLTAYEYSIAYHLDKAGIELIIVGDSLGNVVLGHDSTLNVTMEDMLRHTSAVRKAVEYAMVIADMPFISYQASCEEAIHNAGKLLACGADAVKIEIVTPAMIQRAKSLLNAGIPVMGHLGLTPQHIPYLGGIKKQGKDPVSRKLIIDMGVELEKLGCFCVLLECVPDELSKQLCSKVKVPVLGCGAGPSCDGQVLVLYDILGLYPRQSPKFAKRYVDLGSVISKAVGEYIIDVKNRNL